MEPDKRFYRKLKRVIKREGSRHRRRDLKRQLVDNPEEAHFDEEDLGDARSNLLNGLDQDATRRRGREP
jgi:hypothetical protein